MCHWLDKVRPEPGCQCMSCLYRTYNLHSQDKMMLRSLNTYCCMILYTVIQMCCPHCCCIRCHMAYIHHFLANNLPCNCLFSVNMLMMLHCMNHHNSMFHLCWLYHVSQIVHLLVQVVVYMPVYNSYSIRHCHLCCQIVIT